MLNGVLYGIGYLCRSGNMSNNVMDDSVAVLLLLVEHLSDNGVSWGTLLCSLLSGLSGLSVLSGSLLLVCVLIWKRLSEISRGAGEACVTDICEFGMLDGRLLGRVKYVEGMFRLISWCVLVCGGFFGILHELHRLGA